jgi:hypothetical protein
MASDPQRMGRPNGTVVGSDLDKRLRDADIELAEPGRWGTTFTLIQSWGKLAG